MGERYYQEAKKLKAKIKMPIFTTAEGIKALGYANQARWSKLAKALVEAEVLEQLNSGKKNDPACFKWTNGGIDKLDRAILPKPEDVGQFLNS
jgi:hypothetical protein